MGAPLLTGAPNIRRSAAVEDEGCDCAQYLVESPAGTPICVIASEVKGYSVAAGHDESRQIGLEGGINRALSAWAVDEGGPSRCTQ